MSRDVEAGYLTCPRCRRFYFVDGGIPHLVGEGFAALIDTTFPERHAQAFQNVRRELDSFLRLVSEAGDPSGTHRWNIEDARFWDEGVYGDRHELANAFSRLSRSRRDAGGRTYPREEALFHTLRPALRGGILLDVGCGISQTIRTLCDPGNEHYVYVGAELSLSALRTNRETLDGDFVLCSADRLPFRPESLDAAITLGTLHHLAEQERTLEHIAAAVRPGGHVALDEVVARRGLARRLAPWRGSSDTKESAHNEFVDVALVRQTLEQNGEILEWRLVFSPARHVLDRWFAEPMRTRPWLTRLVLRIDALCIRTLGRLWSPFSGSEVLALARKRQRLVPAGDP